MKEESRKQKENITISLNVGDGAVITEDQFIKRVEAKKEAREKRKEEQEDRRRVREKKNLLKGAQKQAWDTVCAEFEVQKAKHKRLCQDLRNKDTRVRDLPPKPKRRPQKEVFKEVKQTWEREVETDEDLMDLDEDASEHVEDCELEVSSPNGGCAGVDLDWSSGEEEEQEDVEGEDTMDVCEP
jgi:hypothetical protein